MTRDIVIHTDGACAFNPGPGGWGVVLQSPEGKRELSGWQANATNNTMELVAIREGLRAVKRAARQSRRVDLYTDSKYCLGVLFQHWRAKKNTALVMEIRSIIKTFADLNAHHVKGHAGDPGNERADELARNACTSRTPVDIRA